ncbi:MAG: methionine--tRNA ligase [Sphaerochaetaceae bacterium]|nr:methionine--tRNA ligase [Sphaerochaetaceae bacterium]
MKKRLITSALPYVNNIPHLGNLTQVLSADVFARFCRLRGYQTLYVCGTDEYGTATETRAAKEGVTPRELCDHYHAIHRDIYKWFNIDFDYFGRTSTPKQTEIVQDIFKRCDANGYITEKETEQLYCPHCDRFLADRFVEGTCPHCGSPDARGDQCDACQTLLDPTELVNPRCMVCGTTPVIRKTKHLYLDLPKILPLLESWMDEASERGFWAKNAVQVTKSWIKNGLKERCITRDLKWGIPVPKEGYENKVFYVWFDAPIGYVSISANYTDDWKSWWLDPDNTELFQFIGKDNIPFHTVVFPASQLATGQKWTMLHHMSSTEYLNYEGGKFSKSRGIGVFGNDVQETGIPADVWRFYMYYNRPENADFTFTWKDLQEKVNGELIGNLSNLVNRTLTFVKRFFDGNLGEGALDEALVSQIREKEDEITAMLERADERDALRTIFALSSIGNKAFQDSEPWKLRNTDPEKAKAILRTLVGLIRDLGIMIQPYMPSTSKTLLGFLGQDNCKWADLCDYSKAIQIGDISLLFTKLEDARIDELKDRYSGSQAEREEKKQEAAKAPSQGSDAKAAKDAKREAAKAAAQAAREAEANKSVAEKFADRVRLTVSKITKIDRHPNGEYLYILGLDTGEPELRTIVSSIVPYYKEEELLGHNIVLVNNLKPANFRGVKSNGMLLAAQDPNAAEHETCEVLFADDIPAGTNLVPEGFKNPAELCYVKPDHFFEMPLYTKDGYLEVDGHKFVSPEGKTVSAKKYLNGPVG